MASDIHFYINGKQHTVGESYPPTTSLNEYLRETAGLKGTKVMCKEAGCGCCAVTVTVAQTDSDKLETYSVQSCVTPLYSVDGWQISTIEGIGSQRDGFHPIQERIAQFNGTQCGYCTPGMVMNMYGLLHQKPNITAQEIEDNFDGNICRCTGYRPILDAMKSFARDANIPNRKNIDIEDLNKNLCPKTGELCAGSCTRSLDLELGGKQWYRPGSLADLIKVMKNNKVKKTRLVLGNTSTGIFKDDGPYDVYVDIHRVKELFSFEATPNSVRLGAALSLTKLMDKLRINQGKPGFEYFSELVKHLKVVANVMVRNSGCVAGNLMIKYWHREFPSDVFVMLECAGAELEIVDSQNGEKTTVSMMEFLTEVDMSHKVIVAVLLPSLADNVVYRSFKVKPRSQNTHAYVNAAFRIPVDGLDITGRPSICIGGINAHTVHASKTEAFLMDKMISLDVIKEAYTRMKDELEPDEGPLESSPKYRKDVASGLLYKVLLGFHKSSSPKLWTGSENLHRPVSSGLQTFQEKATDFPIHKGFPKHESPVQASGEAVFVNDLPKFQHELFGALTLADVASGIIAAIDGSEVLKVPGVTHFLTAQDIIGVNNYKYGGQIFGIEFPPHELFASKEVHYNGQPLGLVLAETQAAAFEAARKVKVTYSEIRPPVVTIEQSLAKDMEHTEVRNSMVIGSPAEAFQSVDQTVEGTIRMGSQYHFFMETQVSLAVPSEDGIDLYASTQFADPCHEAAAAVIDKPLNFINLTVPRLGGAFGGKTLDPPLFASAATLGAYISGRPVRLNTDLSTSIRTTGKRSPFVAKYKAGFSTEGDVQVIEIEFYCDIGFTTAGSAFAGKFLAALDMGYYVPNWKLLGRCMKTNKSSVQPARGPGTVPAALIIESIMEHVAKAVGRHPVRVKELNLYEKGQKDYLGHTLTHCTVRDVWRRLKDVAEVEGRLRQVDAFNQENTWRKRAITMTTSKYPMAFFGPGHDATVTIFARDGSVVVTQSGIEMGQGLHTKVAQGIAHVLGVPIEKIKVRASMRMTSPISMPSGGSISSESSMQAAISAAQILKERMQPVREKYPDADWKTLCQNCDKSKIDMCARSLNRHEMGGEPLNNYYTYCAAVTETEVDILTGESQIRRVDIMADYGDSLNPVIDIGQTEGGYVMGLGNYLSEDTKFDLETGRILTDGTWNYKPPTTKDIPIDWRVHLLPDTPNPFGIRGSKASGEPSICLSVGALLANKQAVEFAREELFDAKDFIPVDAPFTPEKTQQSVGLSESALLI